jgi:hypothetical protein
LREAGSAPVVTFGGTKSAAAIGLFIGSLHWRRETRDQEAAIEGKVPVPSPA